MRYLLLKYHLKLVTPKKLAELMTINGTDIMLIKLITAVNEIDKATSPLANLVNTFEVTPPGAAAIIINPTANGADKFNIKATLKQL